MGIVGGERDVGERVEVGCDVFCDIGAVFLLELVEAVLDYRGEVVVEDVLVGGGDVGEGGGGGCWGGGGGS